MNEESEAASSSSCLEDNAIISILVINLDFALIRENVSNEFVVRKPNQTQPVVRIFGSTSLGQRACIHVHGVLPYVYFRPENFKHPSFESAEKLKSYLPILENSLEDIMHAKRALSYQSHKGANLDKGVKRKKHIHHMEIVKKKSIYGMWTESLFFVKAYLYDPGDISRLGLILEEGAIAGITMLSFESHIPYLLKFTSDFNIQPMGWIHLSDAKFRSPLPAENTDHKLPPPETITKDTKDGFNSPVSKPLATQNEFASPNSFPFLSAISPFRLNYVSKVQAQADSAKPQENTQSSEQSYENSVKSASLNSIWFTQQSLPSKFLWNEIKTIDKPADAPAVADAEEEQLMVPSTPQERVASLSTPSSALYHTPEVNKIVAELLEGISADEFLLTQSPAGLPPFPAPKREDLQNLQSSTSCLMPQSSNKSKNALKEKESICELELDIHVDHILNQRMKRTEFGAELWEEEKMRCQVKGLPVGKPATPPSSQTVHRIQHPAEKDFLARFAKLQLKGLKLREKSMHYVQRQHNNSVLTSTSRTSNQTLTMNEAFSSPMPSKTIDSDTKRIEEDNNFKADVLSQYMTTDELDIVKSVSAKKLILQTPNLANSTLPTTSTSLSSSMVSPILLKSIMSKVQRSHHETSSSVVDTELEVNRWVDHTIQEVALEAKESASIFEQFTQTPTSHVVNDYIKSQSQREELYVHSPQQHTNHLLTGVYQASPIVEIQGPLSSGNVFQNAVITTKTKSLGLSSSQLSICQSGILSEHDEDDNEEITEQDIHRDVEDILASTQPDPDDRLEDIKTVRDIEDIVPDNRNRIVRNSGSNSTISEKSNKGQKSVAIDLEESIYAYNETTGKDSSSPSVTRQVNSIRDQLEQESILKKRPVSAQNIDIFPQYNNIPPSSAQKLSSAFKKPKTLLANKPRNVQFQIEKISKEEVTPEKKAVPLISLLSPDNSATNSANIAPSAKPIIPLQDKPAADTNNMIYTEQSNSTLMAFKKRKLHRGVSFAKNIATVIPDLEELLASSRRFESELSMEDSLVDQYLNEPVSTPIQHFNPNTLGITSPLKFHGIVPSKFDGDSPKSSNSSMVVGQMLNIARENIQAKSLCLLPAVPPPTLLTLSSIESYNLPYQINKPAHYDNFKDYLKDKQLNHSSGQMNGKNSAYTQYMINSHPIKYIRDVSVFDSGFTSGVQHLPKELQFDSASRRVGNFNTKDRFPDKLLPAGYSHKRCLLPTFLPPSKKSLEATPAPKTAATKIAQPTVIHNLHLDDKAIISPTQTLATASSLPTPEETKVKVGAGNQQVDRMTRYVSLSMELFCITRKELIPNPKHDRIEMIVWIMEDTMMNSEQEDIQRVQGIITCYTRPLIHQNHSTIATSSSSSSSSVGCGPTEELTKELKRMIATCPDIPKEETKIQVATSELELIQSFAQIIQSINPDFIIGYENQKSSFGYLIARAHVLNLPILQLFSRMPKQLPNFRNSNMQHLSHIYRANKKESEEIFVNNQSSSSKQYGDPISSKEFEKKPFQDMHNGSTKSVTTKPNEGHAAAVDTTTPDKPSEEANVQNSSDDQEPFDPGDPGIHLTGRVLLNLWQILRSECRLTNYSYSSVMEQVLKLTFPEYSYQQLTAWYLGNSTHSTAASANQNNVPTTTHRSGWGKPVQSNATATNNNSSINGGNISLLLGSSYYQQTRGKTIAYLFQCAFGNLLLLQHLDLLRKISESARLYGIDFTSVLSRGSQYRVEASLLVKAHAHDYLLLSPSRNRVANQAPMEVIPLVMEPESGYYADPVIVLDFQSLYPSVMIAYNLCFSTCFGKLKTAYGAMYNKSNNDTPNNQNQQDANSNANSNGVQLMEPETTGKLGVISYPEIMSALHSTIQFSVPFHTANIEALAVNDKGIFNETTPYVSPNGSIFCAKSVREGILPMMVKEMLATRVMVKSSIKKYTGSQYAVLQKVLDARQLAIKLLSNVTYGYTAAGFSGRMPMAELADAIVQTGRSLLEWTMQYINTHPEWKAKVVYGDTDSVFVSLPGRTLAQAFAIGEAIAQEITAKTPPAIILKFEKVYFPCILVTKKRYVGQSYEDKKSLQKSSLDAKGIEMIRRDQCYLVQKIQEKSLRLLFSSSGNISLVKAYITSIWQKLFGGNTSLSLYFHDFIFYKDVRYGYYASTSSLPPGAIVITKQLLTDEMAIPPYNWKVPYVVIAGLPNTPLKQLIVTPKEVLLRGNAMRLNMLYYITKCVNPALDRVFSLCGMNIFAWYSDCIRPKYRIRHFPYDSIWSQLYGAKKVSLLTREEMLHMLHREEIQEEELRKVQQRHKQQPIVLTLSSTESNSQEEQKKIISQQKKATTTMIPFGGINGLMGQTSKQKKQLSMDVYTYQSLCFHCEEFPALPKQHFCATCLTTEFASVYQKTLRQYNQLQKDHIYLRGQCQRCNRHQGTNADMESVLLQKDILLNPYHSCEAFHCDVLAHRMQNVLRLEEYTVAIHELENRL